jgi:two-component system response regulator ArlR
MYKVLIIEDEPKIARFLELELKHEGYSPVVKHDGREGYNEAQDETYDLIILDLMLPSLSGIEICRRLRQEEIHTPIIMLTAKDDVSDKVTGLDVGANDYMTKPFAIEELFARMRVLLKYAKTNEAAKGDILTVGELVLDKSHYLVTYNKEVIELTKKEFELLEYLMRNKNLVLSRESILQKVWGYEYEGDTNVIDVYIRYLRSKIDQRFSVNLIKTVRGIGYQIKENENSGQ